MIKNTGIYTSFAVTLARFILRNIPQITLLDRAAKKFAVIFFLSKQFVITIQVLKHRVARPPIYGLTKIENMERIGLIDNTHLTFSY
jgi:hypothetical protein